MRAFRQAVLLAVAGLGCADFFTVGPVRSSGSSPAQAPPREPPRPAPARTVTPRMPPATAYSSRPPPSERRPALFEDTTRTAFVRRLRAVAAQGDGEVVFDDRLDAAMDDLARSLREKETPSGEAVEFLLTHHGIPAPYPAVLIWWIPPERAAAGLDAVAASVTELHGRYSVFGVGMDTQSSPWTVVIAWLRKSVEIDSIPRRIEPATSVHIEARLLGTFGSPRVVVTTPVGSVIGAPVSQAGRTLSADVTCDKGPGMYKVEIMASDASGPTVVANFPIYCAVDPPRQWVGAAGYSARSVRPEDTERRLLDLVNRERRTAGLGQVAPDPALAAVARAHSRDMLENDVVAHVSARTGNPMDRVRAAGLSYDRLLENVGRAGSPEELHKGLMDSPAHRSAILDAQVTHVGIGAVPSRDPLAATTIYATELFR